MFFPFVKLTIPLCEGNLSETKSLSRTICDCYYCHCHRADVFQTQKYTLFTYLHHIAKLPPPAFCHINPFVILSSCIRFSWLFTSKVIQGDAWSVKSRQRNISHSWKSNPTEKRTQSAPDPKLPHLHGTVLGMPHSSAAGNFWCFFGVFHWLWRILYRLFRRNKKPKKHKESPLHLPQI